MKKLLAVLLVVTTLNVPTTGGAQSDPELVASYGRWAVYLTTDRISLYETCYLGTWSWDKTRAVFFYNSEEYGIFAAFVNTATNDTKGAKFTVKGAESYFELDESDKSPTSGSLILQETYTRDLIVDMLKGHTMLIRIDGYDFDVDLDGFESALRKCFSLVDPR